jgi:hypothetical protein
MSVMLTRETGTLIHQPLIYQALISAAELAASQPADHAAACKLHVNAGAI